METHPFTNLLLLNWNLSIMYLAICPLSVIPIRKEPDDTSEIVSQLLFGETMTVLLRKKNWIKISCTHDGYVGYIDVKQHLKLPDNYEHKNTCVSLDIATAVASGDFFVPILMGSTLPHYDGMNLKLGKEKYTYNGQAVDTSTIEPSPEWAVRLARKYLYAPYLWGGRSPFGIDCSGLTQMIYKMMGIPIQRDASQQIQHGEIVDFIQEGIAGDLAFFHRDDKIHHVGMLINSEEIIHASGQVRIDKIDQYGIFNKEKKKYTHELRLIKRLF